MNKHLLNELKSMYIIVNVREFIFTELYHGVFFQALGIFAHYQGGMFRQKNLQIRNKKTKFYAIISLPFRLAHNLCIAYHFVCGNYITCQVMREIVVCKFFLVFPEILLLVVRSESLRRDVICIQTQVAKKRRRRKSYEL